MKKLIFLFVAAVQLTSAQGSVCSNEQYEPRNLIDVPTAGMIPHGTLALDFYFYQNGGLLGGISIGAFDYFFIGISYGGGNIIGSETPLWNSTPGFQARLRIINESILLPAIALGFESQGKEIYNRQLNRYTIKSLGFYAVASKNYSLMGNLSFHVGVNYSLERADGDRDPNLFAGIEKSFGPSISFMAEYNIGWNDSHSKALGKGRGYFNAGGRISIGKGFSLGFYLKDILKNQQEISVGNRIMTLEYINPL